MHEIPVVLAGLWEPITSPLRPSMRPLRAFGPLNLALLIPTSGPSEGWGFCWVLSRLCQYRSLGKGYEQRANRSRNSYSQEGHVIATKLLRQVPYEDWSSY